MKIVVLAGGTSTEREVSIVSGTGVCKALRSLGHQAILLDVFTGDADADPETVFDGEYDVDGAAEKMRALSAFVNEEKETDRVFFGPQVLEICKAADFVFMALHGANGEDGRVQAVLDLYKIRYSGTDYVSSAIAMDKTRTKQIFRASGIPTPKGKTVFKGHADAKELISEIHPPLIVKPQCGGSSIGITICNTVEELEKGLENSFLYEDAAIVEQFIIGRELTAAVLGDTVYPVVEIAPKQGFYDYTNKYEPGMTIETCPAEIPEEKTEEIREIALQAHAALGIKAYARYDFIMRDYDSKVYCLEANTLPGMTPTSLVPLEARTVGIGYPELCQKLIDLSLQKYGEQTE